MIEILREYNRTFHAEKSNRLKLAHPNMDIRELEQKKEMLHKYSGTVAAKDQSAVAP